FEQGSDTLFGCLEIEVADENILHFILQDNLKAANRGGNGSGTTVPSLETLCRIRGSYQTRLNYTTGLIGRSIREVVNGSKSNRKGGVICHQASRFVIVTRKKGFSFSEGSI